MSDIMEELQELCEEFDCPPGIDRVVFLRTKLRSAAAAVADANERIERAREVARQRDQEANEMYNRALQVAEEDRRKRDEEAQFRRKALGKLNPTYSNLYPSAVEEGEELAHARLQNIIVMLQAGHTRKEIATLTGFSYVQISGLIKVLELEGFAKRDEGRWKS